MWQIRTGFGLLGCPLRGGGRGGGRACRKTSSRRFRRLQCAGASTYLGHYFMSLGKHPRAGLCSLCFVQNIHNSTPGFCSHRLRAPPFSFFWVPALAVHVYIRHKQHHTMFYFQPFVHPPPVPFFPSYPPRHCPSIEPAHCLALQGTARGKAAGGVCSLSPPPAINRSAPMSWNNGRSPGAASTARHSLDSPDVSMRGGEFRAQEACSVGDAAACSLGLDWSGRLGRKGGRGGSTVKAIVSADYNGDIKVFIGFWVGSHHAGC